MHGFDLSHIAFILSLLLAGGLLLQRFRQPALVGYLVMGAIIGPGLLGFQGETQAISSLADVAIVLLMFMLGLELDLGSFRASFRKALGAALLQAAAGVAAMLVLSLVFGFPPATAVLLGFIAALSSTAVAMTTLRSLNEDRTETGMRATAILIAQDIIAIPMIVIVGAMNEGFSSEAFMTIGLALAVIAASLFGIMQLIGHPRWVAWIERILTRGAKQPVVAALALCFGAAALSGYAGLSTAYGAFAMGLLIGNVGTVGASYRSAVEPIHELLMMVFFVSIGFMLDASFILTHLALIGTLLATVVVLKTAITIAILRGIGTPREIAYPLGAILGQIGEFSFVLISLGRANGSINHETYQIGLAVIALSLVISPLWLSIARSHFARVHGIGLTSA